MERFPVPGRCPERLLRCQLPGSIRSYLGAGQVLWTGMVFDWGVPAWRFPTLIEGAIMLLLSTLLFFLRPGSALHRSFSLLMFLRGTMLTLLVIRSANDEEVLADRVLDYFWFPIFLAGLFFVYSVHERYGAARRLRQPAWTRVPKWLLPPLGLGFLLFQFLDRGPHGPFETWVLAAVQPLTILSYVAIAAFLVEQARRVSPGPQQRSLILVSMGFLLEPVHNVANIFFRVIPDYWFSAPDAILELGIWLATAGTVLFLAKRMFELSRRTRGQFSARTARRYLTLLALPCGTGIFAGSLYFVVGGLPLPPAFPFYAFAVLDAAWGILLVLLVSYALVRFHLFGIEIQVKRAIRQGAVAIVYLAAFLVVFWALPLSTAGKLAAGTLALVPLLFVHAPVRRLGRRIAEVLVPHVTDSPSYLEHRRIEIYREALAEAHRRTQPSGPDIALLEQLRNRFGISRTQHRVLMLLLESESHASQSPVNPSAARFRIERELGRGSSGRALLAHDKVLDRAVVLKQPLAPWLFDEAGRKLFLQEARLAARIQHPNVVTLYEVLPEGETPSLVLEYVPGGNLREVLLRERRLGLDRAVQLALGVLAGVARIHQAGILHRDLKPANILINAEGVAKITDFGVAKPPTEPGRTATNVGGEFQPGTLLYMSPEQVRGVEPDKRSDLFAVGAVLYQMLTGRSYLDFSDLPAYRIRDMIMRDAPRLPADGIPGPFVGVLRKGLAKEPDKRFQSAEEMSRSIESALRSAYASAPVSSRVAYGRRAPAPSKA